MNDIIEIPVTSNEGDGEEEFLEVNINQLPESLELIEVLKGEKSKLSVWNQVAQAYYKQRKYDGFYEILKAATDPDHASDYAGSVSDKITCLNTLCAYYLQLAENERDKTQRESYLDQAVNYNNRTGQLDMNNLKCWLGRIIIGLLKNEKDSAKKSIEFALKEDRDCVPAKLGLANLYYNMGAYDKALPLYRECLKFNPTCPAEVRLGIGQCLMKLGKNDIAKLAFHRTLKLNPTCVAALVALGTLEMNSNEADGLIKGMRFIRDAYDIEPKNSLVLNILSDHFFFKKNYDKSYTFAQSAMDNCDFPPVKALSCYYIGRLYQMGQDYSNAFQYYYKASSFDASLVLAQYGLGQMYLYRGEIDNALRYIEKVSEKCQDNYECCKILAHLHAVKSPVKAYEYIKKVTDQVPNDVEAWIERAILGERIDLEDSINSYKKAIEILNNEDCGGVPELLNNLSVLRYVNAEYEDSIRLLKDGLEVLEHEEDIEGKKYFKLIAVTMNYNLGRVYESQGRYVEAEKIYKKILKEHPNYVDCYLRLGAMARENGKIFRASEWFKDSYAINNGNLATRSLMGGLHVDKSEWKFALDTFEGILKLKPGDSYSRVAIGNVCLSYALVSNGEKQQRYFKTALENYQRALKADSKNFYAANGIGAVLAEQGHLDEAGDIFLQVREATNDLADVWINLANIYVSQKKFLQAIKLYENCLKKFFFSKNVEILMLMGKAYFLMKQFKEARKVLTKAKHIAPFNLDVQYNLALCHQQWCSDIIAKTDVSSEEVVLAKREIKHSIRLLQVLASKKPESKCLFTPKRANDEFRISRDLYKKADILYTKVKKTEHLNLTVQKEVEIKQQEYLMKEAEEKKLKELEKEKQVEELKELERKLIEDQNKVVEEQRQMVTIQRESANSKKRAASDSGDDGSGEEKAKKSKKKSRKRNKKSDGEFGDDAPKTKRRKEKSSKKADDKYKSAAEIDSDDESGSGSGNEKSDNNMDDVNDLLDYDEDDKDDATDNEEEYQQKQGKEEDGSGNDD